jgi:hypothetical protein
MNEIGLERTIKVAPTSLKLPELGPPTVAAPGGNVELWQGTSSKCSTPLNTAEPAYWSEYRNRSEDLLIDPLQYLFLLR